MSNLMQRGATFLGRKQQSVAIAGTAVTYRRADKTISATGTHSLAEHEVIDREGFPTKAKFHDWVFTASDLVLFGETVSPRPGDRIEAAGSAYEILPLDDKRPCVEPLDADGLLIVVHSKQVAA